AARLARGERPAVRLLPVGTDHGGGGLAGAQPLDQRRRHRRRHVRQPVPVRDLPAHPASRRARGRARPRGPAMTAGYSRREFLRGGVLVIGVAAIAPGCASTGAAMRRRADEADELAPNMYVTVLATGRVAVTINKTELGQGVSTLFATLVAEELEVE